jgi:simple sugar transport system substrate-binding protein
MVNSAKEISSAPARDRRVTGRKIVPVLIFFALTAFGSCKSYRLSALVLTTSKLDAAYSEIEDAAAVWGKAAGIRVVVDAPALPTAAEQQQTLEKRLPEKWDIICAEPLGILELSPLLENAKDRGSIVVSLNGRRFSAADCDIEPFSPARLGEAMMEALAAAQRSGGSYITLLPSVQAEKILDIEAAAVRLQRQKYGAMMAVDRLSETGGEAAKARRAVEGGISRYPLHGALFFTTPDGQGAAGHINAAGNHVAAVGLGEPKILKKSVEDGAIDALFYWDKSKLVLAGLEMGRMIASGRKLSGEAVFLPVEGYETLRPAEGNVWES